MAIVLTAFLPARVANHPRWLLPGLAAILFVIVLLVNPTKSPERAKQLRPLTFSLLAVMSIGNAASAARLIVDLVNGEGIKSVDTLLLTGGAIWVTNMIIFAVWYWEFDRGGPGARAMMTKQYPDFVFPQMTDPTNADPEWEPHFVDYLYLSFTNATAFSPTDVMPYAAVGEGHDDGAVGGLAHRGGARGGAGRERLRDLTTQICCLERGRPTTLVR